MVNPPRLIVFARYSVIKAGFYMALLTGLAALCFYYLFGGSSHSPQGAPDAALNRFEGFIIAAIMSAFWLIFMYQLLVHRGRVIYVRGDRMFYFSGFPMSAPLVKIRDARVRTREGRAGLVTIRIRGVGIRFWGGGSTFVPSGALSERPEVVVTRLQSFLSQQPHPETPPESRAI